MASFLVLLYEGTMSQSRIQLLMDIWAVSHLGGALTNKAF